MSPNPRFPTLQKNLHAPIEAFEGTAYLQDETILQDEACDGIDEDKDQGQHQAPHHDDAPGLWKLHQFGDLKACEVIDREQAQQDLHAPAQLMKTASLELDTARYGPLPQALSLFMACQGTWSLSV